MENKEEGFRGWGRGDGRSYLRRFIVRLIGVLVVLLVVGLIVSNAVKSYAERMNPNTIVINGTGKVSAVPDVSTINFTIRVSSDGNDTKTLQAEIAKKAESTFAKLEDLGIVRTDMRTSNYSVNPKYSYRDCSRMIAPCESSYVVGYEASESVDIKIRNTENVSKVLDVLAEEKITEVYGPNFEVDDVERLKNEARNLAIRDAREKAKVLADSLGVEIEKIVSFSDASSYPPVVPMAYDAMRNTAKVQAEVMPQIEAGQEEIVSNVAITFQIRN